jgi:glutathione S-transferase
MTKPVLISFDLCPYVQRASIVLAEKGVAFERVNVDLADKPDWFKAISPLGKVPLLRVGEEVLFESAVIAEYLDEAHAPRLHPSDPLARAKHRAWIEFASSLLADIWAIETTKDRAAFDAKVALVRDKFVRLEGALGQGPFFAGESFSLADAAFAPVFRYFDVFDRFADLGATADLAKVAAWRRALAARPSVREAVVDDYPARLRAFLVRQGGVMAGLAAARPAAA